MSEFKFACPVCGQHITADSTTSGTQLDCPTCFRKIIVPQAPATTDSKLILSAAQADRPRAASVDNISGTGRRRRSSVRDWIATFAFLLALGACGAAVYFWRDKLFHRQENATQAAANHPAHRRAPAAPRPHYPVPTNTSWTMDLAEAVVPASRAAGRLHGRGFFCERAILQGGSLTLRQGRTGPPDLGLTLHLPVRLGEELSGRTFEIVPNHPRPVPRAVLRWRNEQQKGASRTFNGGYALRLAFGSAINKRIAGQIFIALPDDAQSFVAGTFDAEIRKPPPPRPRPPKAP